MALRVCLVHGCRYRRHQRCASAVVRARGERSRGLGAQAADHEDGPEPGLSVGVKPGRGPCGREDRRGWGLVGELEQPSAPPPPRPVAGETGCAVSPDAADSRVEGEAHRPGRQRGGRGRRARSPERGSGADKVQMARKSGADETALGLSAPGVLRASRARGCRSASADLAPPPSEDRAARVAAEGQDNSPSAPQASPRCEALRLAPLL